MMEDIQLNKWRGPLQKARALFKKIEVTTKGPARDALVAQHKKLLEEARKNLGQENRNGNPEEN
jgi:hypothetical protein